MKHTSLFCLILMISVMLEAQTLQTEENSYNYADALDNMIVDYGAEKRLKAFELIPEDGFGPQPQGIVDENCPWLHVIVPMYEQSDNNATRKEKIARLKYKRRFYFELSQDPTFSRDVLRSGPKRWSFYNPYKQLRKGIWYWRYGVADPETPDNPVWNKDVYSFEITGKEFKVPVPPTPEVFVASVLKRPAPIFLMFKEELGKLLPWEKWPAMAEWTQSQYEKDFLKDTPMKFDVSDQDAINDGMVDKNGNPNAKLVFYEKKVSTKFLQCSRYISSLVAGYQLLGDDKYIKKAIEKAKELNAFSDTATFHIESLNQTISYSASEAPFPLEDFLDIYPEGLTTEEINTIVKQEYPGNWTPPEDFEVAEHAIYDQHLWQEIGNKFQHPIRFVHYHEEAIEELKYAYELWLFRAPSLGRNDGGSLEGDGYLGVHDNYLGTIPWLIYKLTGYNHFKASRWYNNLGKYLTYINPFGTAGNGYCDGDGEGATMFYTMETMAHLNPGNYWNLWRLKSIQRPDFKTFTADISKGSKAYSLLSVWANLNTPDVSKLNAPKELAAVFRDIGEAGMHTDLEKTENDLQVTLHSSPYGSLMHTHPCQNAFNLAYGGQDLFWKTGFYNGGSWHNLLSYKSSRAHNTIMPDGRMQGFHRSAYGWIPRFVHGDKISYVVGDASNAYNGQNRYISPNIAEAAILSDPRYGGGDPGVKKFRRHLVMLRPSHVLVYDELEAKQPIPWEFRLHSRRWMKLLDGDRLLGKNDYAVASAKMFCKSPIRTTLRHKYMPNEEDGIAPIKDLKPEDMWLLRPSDDENKLPDPIPEHFHGAFTTIGKHTNMRFLTLIEIHPGKDENYIPVSPQAVDSDGMTIIEAGDYTITVQLDGNKPSYLHVTNQNETAALVTGEAARNLSLGNENKVCKLSGSTLLMEKDTCKGNIFIEATDSIPEILIYGNKF